MERTISYMLKHMYITENNIELIRRRVVRQSNFNKVTAIFCVLATANICQLHNRIDSLTKEIKELKDMKGE